MNMPIKICRKCQAEFHGRDCKKCAVARAKLWAINNRERKNEINAAYRIANPEKNKVIHAAYRANNKEKIKLSSIKYYSENKDKITSYQYRWAAENKDRLSELSRAWRINNPQKIKARNRRERDAITNSYISRLLKLPVNAIPEELFELKRIQIQITRKLKELKDDEHH